MNYDREIKYMTKELEKARMNLIYAQSHDNTPQEQIKNLVEKIKTIETILDAIEIASHVRHGRWIDKGEYAVCMECGGRSGTQYDGVEPIPLMTQFCSNCGAKMDGKDDENG